MASSPHLSFTATGSANSDISISSDEHSNISFDMSSPQSLPPTSPTMLPAQVIPPSSLSDHSTSSVTSSRKKPDKEYEELDLPLVDESLRLPSGKFQCPLLKEDGKPCLRQMDIPRDLRKHLRDHIKPVLCPYRKDRRAPCYVQKAYPRDMDRHIDSSHTNRKGVEGKYKCRVCKKSFRRSDHLKRHVTNICGKHTDS